ncbi:MULTISPECIES: SDR family NAD(P)-dependent oxidoreductase [unclassified Streptomyces]|uniref:SDR family NAD(P)-dependent oxidoreductase n=1 Tax=unclassified Streptomyces TaxID=2593676 RepID=UPI000DAE8B74|nr:MULTISPECIES: SDR family oxidoreductase [unclassified Streptomyces]PZT73359.1 short-chain dehydrogenase [Streptomyces sp. AC1-42T]PZT83653.1 short-chain dehydrogenase [Streptomyces sp. AC1-42W]
MTRIALITGANRGLGRSTALHLAESGTDLILTYRSHADEAEAVVEEARKLGRTAIALRLDTGDTAAIPAFTAEVRQALAREWGRDDLDILVNNAGHGVHASFAETTEEQFDGLMDVHVKGVFFLTQALLPLIKDGGRILNVSTGLTRFIAAQTAAYAAAKGAVEILTRYLAKELGPRGIAVNALAPGATGTDFGGGGVRDDHDMRAMLSGVTAMGRPGEPDDIGTAAAALLAEGTSWVTGQRIEASGGMLL